MRIAINAMILGRSDSGVGIFTRGLIRALALHDRENHYLIYHGLDSGEVDTAGAGNVQTVRVPVHNGIRPRRIAWEQFQLPGRLKRDRIDLLHAPAYVHPVLVDVPTVVTVHDLFALTHPHLCKPLNVLHYRFALPGSIRRAAAVHCLSHYTRDQLVRLMPEAGPKTSVVHPGIDGVFTPDVPRARVIQVQQKYGIGPEAPFLFVGNVEPKKNLSVIFDALGILEHHYGSRRRLVVAGQQGWRCGPTLAHLARAGLGDRVVWCGYAEREELPALYRMALCLVFPSICEGLGIPPLEAMRCGTPVIVSEVTALPETAGSAALYCSPTNPFSLADKMRTLESDEALRQQCAQAGLERAKHFSWRRAAHAMVSLYRRIGGSASASA